MTNTTKQILPALQNSSKLQDPDLSDIGSRNYTATILKYANLAVTLPQLETEAKQVVPAINEVKNSIPDVAVTQIQTTGTKIATIAIDSTSTDLYAPTGGGASSLSGLSDVTITTPSVNQVLSYDGSGWVNTATSASPVTVTLLAASWNSSTHLITVNVTGVTANSVQDVIGLPATSAANIANNTALQTANIMDAGQAAGTLTFYAETVPTSDLQIRVIVRI